MYQHRSIKSSPSVIYFWTTLSLFFFTPFFIHAQSCNELLNPSFEEGINGWSTTGDVSITSDALSGTQAAKICGGPGSISQIILATPGETYSASIWGKLDGIPDYQTAGLRFLDASYTPLPDAPIFFGFPSENEFTLREFSAVAPADAVYAHLLVYKENNGCVIVDDGEICMGGGNPDLTLTNVDCPDDFPAINDEVTWKATVLNNGNTTSLPTPIYLHAYSPGVMGYETRQLSETIIPPLEGGQSIEINITAPNSAHSPNTGQAGYGDSFLLTSDFGLSFSSDVGINAPEFNETNIFPDIFCKKYNTDLETKLSTSATSLGPNEALIYTIEVTNNGPEDAHNILTNLFNNPSVVFPTPSGSAVLDDGTIWTKLTALGAGATLESNFWHIPFLGIGESTSATITLTPTATPWPGTGADISHDIDSGHNSDPTPTNNSDELNILVDSGPGDFIDLELSLSQPNSNPSQWSSYTVTATLENNGDIPATGVQVSFSKPSGVVYTGGNEFDASQGSFSPNGDEVWTIGTIAPGASATLDVNYFLLNSSSPLAFAEVSTANEPDIDSTPGNGTSPTPNEDDEANTEEGDPIFTDLSVVNVLPIGGTVMPGDNLTGEFSVYYAGPFATVNFKYTTYLSTDPVLSADDVLINNQSYTVTSFPSGVQTPFQVNFTMPSGFPDGQIYFLALVDPFNEIPEADENNNLGFNSFFLDNGNGLPDLTISNFEIPAPTVEAGDILNYNFDLKNIGSGNATGDFFIRAYISDDGTLSPDDIQDGTILTGNFNAGFSVEGVPGASTMPSNLPTGNYHLFLIVDADDQVQESEEFNNTFVETFTVTNSGQPAGDCENDISNGNYICSLADGAGSLSVVSQINDERISSQVNANGDVLNNQVLGPVPPFIYENVTNGKIVRLENGVEVFSKDIPSTISDEYDLITKWTTFDGGLVLFAYKDFEPAVSLTLENLFVIKTDFDLNVISETLLPGFDGPVYGTFIRTPKAVTPNRLAFISNIGNSTSQSMRLVVLDELFDIKSSTNLGSGFSVSGQLKESPCGEWELQTSIATSFCIHGSCFESERQFGDFIGDNFVPFSSIKQGEQSTYGNGTRFKSWGVLLSNGSAYSGTLSQQIPFPMMGPSNDIIVVKTVGGTLFWQKIFTVPDAFKVVGIQEINGELVFIQEDNGVISLINAQCLEDNPPPNDGVDLELMMTTSNTSPQVYSNSSIDLTIKNTGSEEATGVVIEFKRPNGTVYTGGNEYDASQGIFNPFGPETWEVGTIPAGGSATLSVNYFMLTGNALTPFAQVIEQNEPDVDSTPNNGACCTPGEDDEATLTLNGFTGGGGISLQVPDQVGRDIQLKSIDPNPIYFGEAKVTFLSRVEGVFELECYDLFGRLAFVKKIDLREGKNEILLDVSDLRSGTYYLNMPGENWRHMPIRFVVARW